MALHGFLVAAAVTLPLTRLLSIASLVPAPASNGVKAGTCQDAGGRVAVHLSNRTTLEPRDVRVITGIVDAVWARYGVRFDWGAGRGGVEIVLEPGTVPPAPGSAALPLASIVFVDGRVTSSISASHGNARLLAGGARLNDRAFVTLPPPLQRELIARMLGVAVAHELGHYLLNDKSHSAQGLLRPNIPIYQLMEANLHYLRLGRDQLAMLCSGVRGAAGAPASSDPEPPATSAPVSLAGR